MKSLRKKEKRPLNGLRLQPNPKGDQPMRPSRTKRARGLVGDLDAASGTKTRSSAEGGTKKGLAARSRAFVTR